MRLILASVSFLALSLCTSAADQRGAAPLSNLPLAARSAISNALGRDVSQYYVKAVGSAFETNNARQQLSIRFAPDGVSFRHGNTFWRIAARGYGYGGTLKTFEAATPYAHSNRVEYRRGPLTEWYANGPAGLEQGFTINAPPGKPNGQPLTIALSLSGDLTAMVSEDGQGLTLTNRQKHATLRYTGLVSRDGNGKELRTWLELQGERVLLKVEDAGARYPLVIDPWVQLAELTASDGVTSQSFGLAVAINDDTVVVGENCNEIVFGACNLTRAVYVFVKPTSGWANMTEVAKLTASDGIVADQFGTSVAVDGDTVVVGAPGHNNFAGAVYVFVKPTGGWANMTEVAKLTASDGKAGDFFGASVAVSGNDRAIVIGGVNAAYVFLKPERGWNTTSNFNAKMTGSDAAPNNLFGISVAISGKTVVVGAPFFHGATGPGAAYVFVRPAGGWTTMTETAKLTPSDGTTFDEFGLSTAVSGKTIVVGSPQEPGSNGEQGVAYVFEEPPGGWTNMTQTARLIASDGSTGGHIGSSVAVSGNTAVVGAFLQNEAYVFVKPKGGWTDMTETAKLMPGQGAFFGFSVSISRTTIAVGDPFFNSFEGAAYVFGPVK